MAVLVENHAHEQRQDKQYTTEHRLPAMKLDPIAKTHPEYDQEEGGVHVNVDPPEPGNFPGPFHKGLQTLKRAQRPEMTRAGREAGDRGTGNWWIGRSVNR